jgi:hypothetical protein
LIPIAGPLCLVLAGSNLIVPQRFQAWNIPVLSAPLGLGVGMTIAFDAPPTSDWIPYAMGAAVSSVWLVIVVFLIGQTLPRRLTNIARPILGSWIVAIGLLLGAAEWASGSSAGANRAPMVAALRDPWLPAKATFRESSRPL